MTIYGISTYGKDCVLDEESDVNPWLRNLMLVLYVIYGLWTTFQYIQAYAAGDKVIARKHGTTGLLKCLFILHTFSHLFRYGHFFDHTFRPVRYREPKFVYMKYLITQMEFTFYLNIPITIAGLKGIQNLINGVAYSDQSKIRRASWFLSFHIFMCCVNFVHYTMEPLSYFSLICHLTIAGPPISAILFGIALLTNYGKLCSEAGGTDDQKTFLMDEDEMSKQKGAPKEGTPRRRSRPDN